MYLNDALEEDLDLEYSIDQLKNKVDILNHSLESLGLKSIRVDSNSKPNEKDISERINETMQLIRDAEKEAQQSLNIEQELTKKIDQTNEKIVCHLC